MAAPPTPTSPNSQSREKERISLLLEINRELLQETVGLQAKGKGGVIGQQRPAAQTAAGSEEGGKDGDGNKPASKEYIEYVYQREPFNRVKLSMMLLCSME